MLPLDGVTVVDFTQFLAGPFCTMQLGDLGADVIKVERPGSGDDSRRTGPFVNGESACFAMPNRNKRSVVIDLSVDEGRLVARRLIRQADVVVENFRPGVADRLGVGYTQVGADAPHLIYCSITGFGQTGPDSHRAGLDIIAQGMVGFLRMTGPPGGEPAKFGVAVNDLAAGLTAANAVLAAYIHRLRRGGGQYIDVALVDAGLALTVWEAGAYFGSGEVPAANGTRHRRSAPYQAFRTADGYVTVGANTDRLWLRLCHQVLDRPDLAERPDYADARRRAAHADALEVELAAVFATATTDSWVAALDRAGVPGGPVLTYDQALAHRQVAARDMVVTVDHPKLGALPSLGPAAKMSETPPSIRRPAPLLAQHSVEVLTGAGYDRGAIDALLGAGVVEQHPEHVPRRSSGANADG